MTLDYTLTMLKSVKGGIIDEPRVIAFVSKRGLAFEGNSENLAKLKNAGASNDFLDLIRTLKPPPPPKQQEPPPPPPKPVTGTLRFTCAPAECDIRIDGGPDKKTKGGKLVIGDLVYRQYSVDFRKEGYQPQSLIVRVGSEMPPEIAIKLDVLPEVRAKWGRELYQAAVQAVGLAELKTMTAIGAASSWSVSGTQSEWTIKSVFNGNNYTYELNNTTAGTFSLSCQDETCAAPKGKGLRFGKKKLNGPEADSLNTNFRQYNRYHLEALLARIGDEKLKLSANAAPAAGTGDQHLIAENNDESYDIAFDGSFLPLEVSFKSKDGLATVQISYAEYASFAKSAQYPHVTSVALPGEKKHGIRIKYDSVAPGAK